MKIKRTSLPNSRLLCLTKFWGEDLATSLMEWKELSSQIPGVKVLNDEALLYFFREVEHQEFRKTPFWFSKPVVGFVPEDESYKVMDLDAGECWESGEFEFTTYDQLMAQALKVFEESKTQNLTVASTWAVVLSEESLCQKGRIRLFYQKERP